mmetsp:Transcript_41765/g.90617  ORF Transcript_41765/g.90617 Transcript_41765/m.90617 type:complete len:97 (+) Transcript_41765:645-935(+)
MRRVLCVSYHCDHALRNGDAGWVAPWVHFIRPHALLSTPRKRPWISFPHDEDVNRHRPSPLLLGRYHLAHHYKNPNLGFGISSMVWDVVFGTTLVP